MGFAVARGWEVVVPRGKVEDGCGGLSLVEKWRLRGQEGVPSLRGGGK